jgi:hypothetical protein
MADYSSIQAPKKESWFSLSPDNDHMTDLPEIRFCRLQSLTIRGYYTSKIGIHDELDYKGNVALMEFVGCEDPVPGSK